MRLQSDWNQVERLGATSLSRQRGCRLWWLVADDVVVDGERKDAEGGLEEDMRALRSVLAKGNIRARVTGEGLRLAFHQVCFFSQFF